MMRARRLSVFGRFLEAIARYELLAPSDHVLVAVSGGADSVSLLDLLRLASDRLKLKLTGFHLNHRLRDEAAADEAFVHRLAAEWGIMLEVVHADVAAYARKHRLGIEEAGRELRYRHMERLAERLGCTRIALGHTANDNLETMLLNLVRGTGPQGLAGIPVARGRYIRPLLDMERADLERHLLARGIPWLEDESNKDVSFRRNLLRCRVVTILEEVNPSAVANGRRTAQLLADENEFLERLAADAAASAVTDGRAIRVDTRKLNNYNDILKRRVLKRLVPELDSNAVEAVLRFARRRAGGRLELSSGVRVRLQRGILELLRMKENPDNG